MTIADVPLWKVILFIGVGIIIGIVLMIKGMQDLDRHE